MAWTLTRWDVRALCAGADLLGGGGGGDSEVVEQLLDAALRDTEVTVLSADELPEDGYVIHAGALGAPDVLRELHFDPQDLARAATALATHQGVEPTAVGIIQVGGLNAPLGVLAAALQGLPLVDGDLMGRAFPRVIHTRPAQRGLGPAPLALAGPEGHLVVVHESTQHTLDPLITGIAAEMGGTVAIACHAMTAPEVREHGLPGTLSRCLELGRAFLRARTAGTHRLVEALGATLLCLARVDDTVEANGDAPGRTTLTSADGGEVIRVDHVSEFLAVSVDGRSVASVPTVVAAIDAYSHRVLHVGDLTVGHTVALCSLPPVAPWPLEVLTKVDISAFGFEVD